MRPGRVRSRLRRVRPATGGGGSRVLMTASNFVYRGAYRVLFNGIPGENRNGRGLTGGNIGGTDYLIAASSAGTLGKYAVYAHTPHASPLIGTGYDWAQYPTVTASHVFDAGPYTNAAANRLIGTHDETGENGVGWIDHLQRLYGTYSEGYGSAYGAFCHASLNFANTTAVALGRYCTSDPSGFKAISGGAIEVPQWYADQYTGGKRIVLWAGRNQSIVASQDLSQGLSLTLIDHPTVDGFDLNLSDCATPSAGSTTVTSATGGFTADMVGARFMGTFTGTNWTGGTRTIASYVDPNTITLNTSNTPVGAGSGGTFWVTKVVTSTPVVKKWPTTEGPQAGVSRLLRPDGDPLIYNGSDSWGNDYYTWTCQINGCDWIDFSYQGTNYHAILFVGLSTQFNVGYVNSNVGKGGYRHMIGIYNPMLLPPVTAGNTYDPQPSELTYLTLPALDMTPYVVGDPVTITGITSNSAKAYSSADGCTVTAAGHGRAAGEDVVITGVGAGEYDNAWRVVSAPDANTVLLQNTSIPGNWSGTSASQGQLRKMNGATSGIGIMGIKFFPATRMLYVMHQIRFGVGPNALQTMVAAFEYVP